MKEEILDIAKQLYHNRLTPEYATDLLLRLFAVSGRSEQLVCDYCGKDKVEGLDHCECYNGTTWVKKAN